jgi:transcriptional regulator with XRE-family HTH domain
MLLGLTPTQVAKAGGVSRPYASRLLNERDPFAGSGAVYRQLEARLGVLVDSRAKQFFSVEAVAAGGAEAVLGWRT